MNIPVEDILLIGNLMIPLGSLVILTTSNHMLLNTIGRLRWRTRHSYLKARELRHQHVIFPDEVIGRFFLSCIDEDDIPANAIECVHMDVGSETIIVDWSNDSIGSKSGNFQCIKEEADRRYFNLGLFFLIMGSISVIVRAVI